MRSEDSVARSHKELDMKSWETTVAGAAGFLVILAGAIQAQFDGDAGTIPNWNEVVAAGAIMIGLFRARDNNKPSVKVGAE